MHTEVNDYEHYAPAADDDYSSASEGYLVHHEQDGDQYEDEAAWPQPPRWTLTRVILLLFVLILIAAVVVFGLLPLFDHLLNPLPSPNLLPAVNA